VPRKRLVEHPEKEYAFHNHNIFFAVNNGALKTGMYWYLIRRFVDIAKTFNVKREDYLIPTSLFIPILIDLLRKGAFINKSDAEAFELLLEVIKKKKIYGEMLEIKGYDITKIDAKKITV